MAFPFEVIEHRIPAQHIREWSRATAVSQNAVLQLHIKQYKPIDNPSPEPGDVTIIAGHANGFPKEVYEPLWSDLHTQCKKHGFRIRGIWIADVAHQGQSGLLNKQMLGNDPSWYDAARDLLHMTNVFRAEMPRPIVGIGHSFGGNVLTQLSLLHNRLFSSLVLFDPIINKFTLQQTGAMNGARLSAVRRDTWPSREAAADSFRRSRFYSSWDPRVLQAWITHAIHEVPDEVTGTGTKAALVTSRHQEVFTFFRPLYPYVRPDGAVDRDGAPDFDPAMNDKPGPNHPFPFYRSEGPTVLEQLPHVRPSVLWVFGETSDANLPPSTRPEFVRMCGSGPSGSGGVDAGKVAEITIKARGHLFPMEIPGVCAEHAAAWIGREMDRYRESEREYEEWTRLPLNA
ncbi:prolyl aminopeptidase-like protein [Hypoxylon rubiginosum]|uniref:Prolyl aminopeptidase-like protein n=1 Tax=Hypoxylon rubiginosum TaxID=110542 RepID=A0ACC0CTB3_9PEZI|nr:prolyl aminopeptidase-like protein [Hypoxylon rubiginosum]